MAPPLHRLSARMIAGFAGVCLLAVMAGPFAPARAASSVDPATQREDVRKQKAAVAGQIDALNATSDQVNAALDALDANVRGAQAQAHDAQRAADDAQAEADQAQHDADAAQATIDQLRGQVAAASVDAYVHPPGDQVMDVFQEQNATKAVTKSALRNAANGSKLDVVDEFRTAEHELEVKRDAAAQAQAKASERVAAAHDKLAGLNDARDQQAAVASQVDARINGALAESDALAKLDKNLSAQIAADQAALITKLNTQREAAAKSGGGSGGGGGGGVPIPVSGPIALSTVNGITVASSIAGQLASLMSAASAAGFNLGGGGYRDSAQQIALRRAHCGTSDYAIYQMPASQCHPPTATPGQSMHEQGLAIDFTNDGKLLARGDAAFAWMQANAGSFGLRNLPSEPWHWSVNGS
jgi:hypothetical protein